MIFASEQQQLTSPYDDAHVSPLTNCHSASPIISKKRMKRRFLVRFPRRRKDWWGFAYEQKARVEFASKHEHNCLRQYEVKHRWLVTSPNARLI